MALPLDAIVCVFTPRQLRHLHQASIGFGQGAIRGYGGNKLSSLPPRAGGRRLDSLHVPRAFRWLPGARRSLLYHVAKDVVEALDILEGMDEAIYLREEIPVELLDTGEVITCLSYIEPRRDELLQLKRTSENTLGMYGDDRLKTICDDDKFHQRTPSLRILGALFGSEVADKVQALVDSHVGFHDARKIAVECVDD